MEMGRRRVASRRERVARPPRRERGEGTTAPLVTREWDGVSRSPAVGVRGKGAVSIEPGAHGGCARARAERFASGGVLRVHSGWVVRGEIRRIAVREIGRGGGLGRVGVESTHVVRVGESGVRGQRRGASARHSHVRITVSGGDV